MLNRVVARFRDGRVLKGTTANFFPAKDTFHVRTQDGDLVEIRLEDLKAVFFVKDLAGDPGYDEKKHFDLARVYGQKISCEFQDGECLLGYTQGYNPGRKGFFLIPADPKSNNERVFVVQSFTRRVSVVKG